jgi:hypothetical protein
MMSGTDLLPSVQGRALSRPRLQLVNGQDCDLAGGISEGRALTRPHARPADSGGGLGERAIEAREPLAGRRTRRM